MTILYITFDGVTDHIGRSQVAPYVLGLARLGFKIHILSAEKSGREELVGRYRRLFEDAAIRWTLRQLFELAASCRPGPDAVSDALRRAPHRASRARAINTLPVFSAVADWLGS